MRGSPEGPLWYLRDSCLWVSDIQCRIFSVRGTTPSAFTLDIVGSALHRCRWTSTLRRPGHLRLHSRHPHSFRPCVSSYTSPFFTWCGPPAETGRSVLGGEGNRRVCKRSVDEQKDRRRIYIQGTPILGLKKWKSKRYYGSFPVPCTICESLNNNLFVYLLGMKTSVILTY